MNKKIRYSLLIITSLLLATLFFIYLEIIISFDISSIVNLITSFGILAPVAFILLMALAIVVSPIPSLPLAVASGILFGTPLGFLYSIIGATIGAVIAFLITRKLGREYFIKRFGKQANYLEKIPDNKLMLYIFLFRLLPIFHFDVISYGAGITKISLRKFTIATLLGAMPGTFVFVYTGSMLDVSFYQALILMIIFVILMYLVPKYLVNREKRKEKGG